MKTLLALLSGPLAAAIIFAFLAISTRYELSERTMRMLIISIVVAPVVIAIWIGRRKN